MYFNSVYSAGNRQSIGGRREKFVEFERIYSRFRRKEDRHFQFVLDRISGMICSAGTSVEIGFGYGHELIQFLKRGANIYGIDLSEEAVSRFKAQYPEYSEKVSCAASWDSMVDALYSNALFEHLDHPSDFLRRVSTMLKPGGTLMMRLPLITLDQYTRRDISFDINFWKPCHRMLYTLKGLQIILEAHGFKIVESAAYAYYGYKVMSSMLKHGYEDVTYVRDPCLPITNLDSEWAYTKLLVKGLVTKTICSDFAIIAAKVG
jgi:SAM-dependent methyltransferase